MMHLEACAPEASRDYRRIERAIRYLDENASRQPGLEEVSREIGLSPFHAQRLFTRFAGVSPKRFLGLLTVGHAKTLLQDGQSVLEATYEVGLSGPSRLYDLFVTYEAMTPGEYKRQGADLEIGYGLCPTPFGQALVLTTDRGIAGLSFVDGDAGKRSSGRAKNGRRALSSPMSRRANAQSRTCSTATPTACRASCSRAPTSRSRFGRRCCVCRKAGSSPTASWPGRSASPAPLRRSAGRSRPTPWASSSPATG
jgi:AraC-like DNA-binding protein